MGDNVERRETSEIRIVSFSHTACGANLKSLIVPCGKNELILNF
jgi:hypothetical protein